MFKGIISRDGGEPWGPTGMTTAKWGNIQARPVRIEELWATQPGVLLHALRDDTDAPVGGDHIPHVIDWGGELYLEDGHHRTVRARLAGAETITARVLRVPK
jgi:hypothetical protein